MKARVAISFDDGFNAQYKWAEELHSRGIVGTFYINPMTVGHGKILTLDQLKEIHDRMSHTIANHLWSHIAPVNGAIIDEAIESYQRAGAWLTANDFADGCDLLALPYGVTGGCWTNEHITKLAHYCSQIRDVTNGINSITARKFIGATDDANFVYGDDTLILHYFHGNGDISDEEFIAFLDVLATNDVVMTSMRDIADGELIKSV